jgi:hypothetical protein
MVNSGRHRYLLRKRRKHCDYTGTDGKKQKNVAAFYDLIINKKDYEIAQKLYIGPRYK